MDYRMMKSSRVCALGLGAWLMAAGCGPQIQDVDEDTTDDATEDSTTTNSGGGQVTLDTSAGPTTTPPSPPTTATTTATTTPTTTATTTPTTTPPPTTVTTTTAPTVTDTATDTSDSLPDISGSFLLAVHTIIDPGLPLQYIATFDLLQQGEGGELIMELQPLSLDVGSTNVPRLPVGQILGFVVPVAPDGTFSVPVGALDVPGEANPITGGDVLADGVVMDLEIFHEDAVCGSMEGMLVSPIQVALDGTSVSAVRVADTSPAGLPAIPFPCP